LDEFQQAGLSGSALVCEIIIFIQADALLFLDFVFHHHCASTPLLFQEQFFLVVPRALTGSLLSQFLILSPLIWAAQKQGSARPVKSVLYEAQAAKLQ
jgi:hypothetical protein